MQKRANEHEHEGFDTLPHYQKKKLYEQNSKLNSEVKRQNKIYVVDNFSNIFPTSMSYSCRAPISVILYCHLSQCQSYSRLLHTIVINIA